MARFMIACLVATACAIPNLGWQSVSASCGGGTNHWWARGVAGTGLSAHGTEFQSYIPGHWSVDRPSLSIWDHAAWIWHGSITNTNYGAVPSIEGGYYSGWFRSTGWTNGVVPYYTTSNGYGDSTSGLSYGSWYLTSGYGYYAQAVWGSPSWVKVGPYRFPSFNYTVGSSATNFSQGEILQSTNTWMDGGGGNRFQNYWTPNGTNWYLWGVNTDCADSPYWIQWVSSNSYNDGGY